MDAAYVTESNKIASAGAWIWLMEITTAGYADPLRYANDSSNPGVVWPETGGDTYYRMPFAMEDISIATSGAFPEYKLQVGDVELAGDLRTRIKATGGLVGSTIRLMIVHSAHLSLTTPAVDELAEILNCEVTAETVTFTLGIPSLLGRRFPRDKYVPGFCRHKFEGAMCQYAAGVETSCDHTLDNCRARNNSQNYGGSPGIIGGVYG